MEFQSTGIDTRSRRVSSGPLQRHRTRTSHHTGHQWRRRLRVAEEPSLVLTAAADRRRACATPPSSLQIPPLSLYVHFPWCVRKCPYCDFNSYTLQRRRCRRQPYLARLRRDLAAQAPHVTGREVGSVFLGGGTPSLFSAGGHRALAAGGARASSRSRRDAEVTLEANPGTIERGAFREYRAAGVTRVSLGAQSFDAARLRALGRIHSPADTRRAAAELHAAGLDNFNLDLMYALPGQDVGRGAARRAPGAGSSRRRTCRTTSSRSSPARCSPRVRRALPEEDASPRMQRECAASSWRRRLRPATRYRPMRARVRAAATTSTTGRFGDYLGVGAGAHGKLTLPGGRGESCAPRNRASRAATWRRCGGAGAPQHRRARAAVRIHAECAASDATDSRRRAFERAPGWPGSSVAAPLDAAGAARTARSQRDGLPAEPRAGCIF